MLSKARSGWDFAWNIRGSAPDPRARGWVAPHHWDTSTELSIRPPCWTLGHSGLEPRVDSTHSPLSPLSWTGRMRTLFQDYREPDHHFKWLAGHEWSRKIHNQDPRIIIDWALPQILLDWVIGSELDTLFVPSVRAHWIHLVVPGENNIQAGAWERLVKQWQFVVPVVARFILFPSVDMSYMSFGYIIATGQSPHMCLYMSKSMVCVIVVSRL